MTDPLITQALVEQRLGGPRYLVRLADDDGDGVADATIVAATLNEASRIGEGLLLQGFPDVVRLRAVVAADVALQGAIADVAIGLFGQRRVEWTDAASGRPFGASQRERGEKYLKDVAGAEHRRSTGEAVAGQNVLLAGATTNTNPPTFTFSKTSANPKGPGGF